LSVRFRIALSVIIFAVALPVSAIASYGASSQASRPLITVDGVRVDSLWETRPGEFDYLTPVTDLAGFTGAEYSFFPGTGGILIKKGDHLLELFIDRKGALINGAETTLTQPPRSADGVIYVPLNTVAPALGYSVTYNTKENTFHLSTMPGPPLAQQPKVKIYGDLLPSGSEFFETGKVIKKSDLDGDGKDEYSALYRNNNGKYGVMVYRQDSEGFLKLWQKEEEFPPSLLELADLNGGGSELMVGWNFGAAIGSHIEIYSFKGGSADLLFSGMYHRFEQGDFDGDGKNEFALWQKDHGDTYSIPVFKWNGKMFAPVEYLPGYYKKVVDYYQSMAPKVSVNRSAQYYLAEAYLRSGEFALALKTAGEGINIPQSHPSNADFQRLKGLALVGLERHAEALPFLELSLKGFPGPIWSEARFALSRCYDKTGEPARGRLEMIRALNEGNQWQGYQRALETLKSEVAVKNSLPYAFMLTVWPRCVNLINRLAEMRIE